MISATTQSARSVHPVHPIQRGGRRARTQTRPAPQCGESGAHDPMLPAVVVATAFGGAFANVEQRLRGYPGLVARSLAGTQDFADAQRLLAASIVGTLDAFRAGLIQSPRNAGRTTQTPTYLQDYFDGWAMTRLQDATKESGGQFVTVEQMRDIGQEFINQLCITLTSRMAPAIAQSVLGENYLMRYYPIDKAIRGVEDDLIRFCRGRSA